ncbi:hypothetical protein C3408_08950 [Candidatus Pantoea alvi]|nr:hypothetical protein C3408_08950 [Pantoea alvi]
MKTKKAVLSWHRKIRYAFVPAWLDCFLFSRRALFISGQLCALKNDNRIYLACSASLNKADMKKSEEKAQKIKALNVTQVA